MPTYEYKCESCGAKFERFQSITAPPVKTCPHCHRQKVRRLIGMGAGIIFKGPGFYATDYRSDSYKTAAKNDSGSSSTSTTGSTSSSSAADSSSGTSAQASGGNGNGNGKAKVASKPAAKK